MSTKSLKIITTVVLVTCGLMFIVIRACSRTDKLGQLPEDVVEQFLEAARNGEVDKARSYWGGPSTTEHLWKDYTTAEERFEKACVFYTSFDEYFLKYDGRDKGKYYVVWLMATKNGEVQSGHPFWLFLEDGEWWIGRGPIW